MFVVDDEPKGRTFLCEILAHERYRPQAFDSGTTALEMDIYLPDLDGYAVARTAIEDVSNRIHLQADDPAALAA